MRTTILIVVISLILILLILFMLREQIRRLIVLDVLILKSLVFTKTKNQAKVDIRIFGDSLAFGLGANGVENTFYGLIKRDFKKLSLSDNSEIGNYLGHFIKQLQEYPYQQDLAIIWTGSMNVLTGFSRRYRSKLKKILEPISQNSEQVILFISPDARNVLFFPRFYRNFLGRRSAKMAKVMRQLSQEFDNITIIDYFQKGVFTAEESSLYLADDKIHPNEQSYEVWYNEDLKPLITQHFRSRAKKRN